MYCPACSSEAKPEQKFCRACGFNLQPIIPLLGEHEQAPQVPEKVRRVLQKIEYVGFGVGASGILIIIGILIWAFLALAFLGPEAKETLRPLWNQLFGIGFLLFLKGAFVCGASWLLKTYFPWKSAAKPSLETAKTKEFPEPLIDGVSSITEHTTRNLEPISAHRSDQAIN